MSKRALDIDALSSRFEAIGGWSYDHRWVVLAISALLLVTCLWLASRVHFDNSFEAYFDRDDPLYATYLQFREEFGSDEISYILYEAPAYPHGPWNLEVMRKIESLTEALEDGIPFVKEVTSLVNVEFLEGIPAGLKISDLLDPFPSDQEDLLEARRKVLAKPLYVGQLTSRDGQFGALVIEMEKSAIDPLAEIRVDPKRGNALDNLYPQATYHRISEILARPEYEGIRFYHTGDVPINAVYNTVTRTEAPKLGVICLLLVSGLLFLFLRKPVDVIGPMVVVSSSILVSIALVSVAGWPLDLVFVMLPTVLIAVGVADSVHIISEFRTHRLELRDRRLAARRTMYLVGPPCLLTTLTTAAGLGAMSISPIKAIAHFATYAAVGVLAAFVFSATLLMLFLSFSWRRSEEEPTGEALRHPEGDRCFRRGLEAVGQFDIRHRRGIIAFFAVTFILSIGGMTRLRVDSNFLDEFSDEVPIKRITRFVDDTMGGTSSFIYLFDTGVPDGIKDPGVLREIERFQTESEKYTYLVRKTYSIVDLLKDINQSFHAGDPAYHVLPETRGLVAQYLLLYEMASGGELDNYVSSDYSNANVELRCRLVESSHFAEMARGLDSYLASRPLQAWKVSATGMGALYVALMDYVTASQIRGILLAFVVITAMMCFVFKSIQTGLISMIPNVSPIVLTLGLMGWIDLPLDYVRLLIAAVAIGISVDDTIHLVTRYRHEFQKRRSYEEALLVSLIHVGRALFITSVVLIVGFLVFWFSVMDSVATFGSLVAWTIFVAFVADFTLMPALVLTFRPFGRGGESGRA